MGLLENGYRYLKQVMMDVIGINQHGQLQMSQDRYHMTLNLELFQRKQDKEFDDQIIYDE